MLRLRREKGVSERGSAIVEAMLVLMVTLLVIFGGIQFSVVIFGYNSVAFAESGEQRIMNPRRHFHVTDL